MIRNAERGKRNMGRYYRNKKEFVTLLKAVLTSREDFKDLEYYRHNATGEEWLILTDIRGGAFYFDITGYTPHKIFHTVSEIECGIPAPNWITDSSKQLEIGKIIH